LTVDLNAVTVFLEFKIYTLTDRFYRSGLITVLVFIRGIRDDNGCEDTVNYTVVNQLIAGAVVS
jgi:hypothetical protein